ncbi:MAG: TonB-dependent receptor, partial [Kangiellaceae bacterium]|nr:TonB-dependent receptor [Kangiellaceae bacterium]
NFGFSLTGGDSYEFGEEQVFGFLATYSYRNNWLVSEERNVNQLARASNGVEVQEFADGASTEHSVRESTMINFGYELSPNHKFEFNNVKLNDTRDRLRNRLLESTNTIIEEDEERRQLDVLYEEREMVSHQVKGSHYFPEFENVAIDWFYATSEASRDAPGGFQAFFFSVFENGVRNERLDNNVSTRYTFQTLEDEAENWGGNIVLPMFEEDYTLELKSGFNVTTKKRRANNVDVGILNFSVPQQYTRNASDFETIFSDQNLAQPDFTVRLDDQTNDGDKFDAITTLDAIYLMGDLEMGEWRHTAGMRWENFRQVNVPFQPHSGQFAISAQEIADSFFEEDDLFFSWASTYKPDDETQWRFNVSQTTNRPDLRDITTTFYIDPLTEFLVRGSTSLVSSDITNLDIRWENYGATGNNFSVALFYKDIENPIEQIQLPTATEGAPQLLTANAESGYVYGLEMDFLRDLTFIGDDLANFFLSGNVTISESEVDIGLGGAGDSLFERQLSEALNTTQSVTDIITNNKRRLIGHSEWVANLQLGWDSDDNEHSATVVYNVFGPRIIIPGIRGFEDGEEQPFHSLDVVYTWYPSFDSTMKVRVRNLLDEVREIRQEGVAILRENPGTEVTLIWTTQF